ncbi:MAG: hypothetical protein JSC189_000707 [Candidatus Tokpelaia sp. JSC189]|nr:MAG: hypothetical protein JSC189_000707 [Candidatus Tokpelaia sp. JSC189]
MGIDERTIVDVLGQKTIEMAQQYDRISAFVIKTDDNEHSVFLAKFREFDVEK